MVYIYYPSNFNPEDNSSFQCLLSARQVEPEKVAFSVRSVASLGVTLVWDDANNKDHFRPSPVRIADKLHLYADSVDVTDNYRNNLTIADNNDGTYSLCYSMLPRMNAAGEEIVYTLMLDGILGYRLDTTTAGNGEIITLTHKPLHRIDLIRPFPIKPIPIPGPTPSIKMLF